MLYNNKKLPNYTFETKSFGDKTQFSQFNKCSGRFSITGISIINNFLSNLKADFNWYENLFF